jgi:hypothetical protein
MSALDIIYEWSLSWGLGNLLAQSETVLRAFGPDRGFRPMLVAIAAGASIGIGTVVLVATGIGRAFG